MRVIDRDNDDNAENVFNFLKVIDDFRSIEPTDAGVVPTYVEQEADDASAFNEAHSELTITHFNDVLLNKLGRPMAKSGSLAKWICVHPAQAPKGSNKEERMSLEGRSYNGVMREVASGRYDMYREDVNKMGKSEATRPKTEQWRALFKRFYENDVLRASVIESKNRRQAKYELPYNETGFGVFVEVPYVPDAVYKEIKKAVDDEAKAKRKAEAEAAKAAKEAAKAAAAAKKEPAIKKEVAAAAADKKEPAIKKKAPAIKKKADESAATTSDDDEDDDGEDDMVSPEKLVSALKKTPAKQSAKARDEAAVVRSKTLSATSPRKRKSPEYGYVEVAVPLQSKLMTRTSELTPEALLGHMRALASKKKRVVANAFAGKKTMNEVLADPKSKYALYAVYGYFEYFEPHLLALAEPPHLPGSFEKVDDEFLLGEDPV